MNPKMDKIKIKSIRQTKANSVVMEFELELIYKNLKIIRNLRYSK